MQSYGSLHAITRSPYLLVHTTIHSSDPELKVGLGLQSMPRYLIAFLFMIPEIGELDLIVPLNQVKQHLNSLAL